AREPHVEELTACIGADVESHTAERWADDLDPSSDCGESPQEDLVGHVLSLRCRKWISSRGARQNAAPPSNSRAREIEQAPAPSGKTMLSMPLAYPSTLDRRSPTRGDRRPTWRSFGARASTVCEKSTS